MSLLDFDPNASLKHAREARPLPFSEGAEGSKSGRNGRNGTVPGETEKTRFTADRLADAVDHCEERVAIREHDGGQPRPKAEAAALIEAATFHGISTETLKAALTARNERAQS